MIAMTQKVYNEVLDLPAEERLELVDMLLKNLTPVNDSIEQAWIAEAEKRLDNFRKGKIKAIPGDEVFKRIKERLAR
jgi:putative addiction module component (TIGR02574 family)